jgi:hypothetical protein
MQVPEREIACGWSSESAVDTRFPVEIWREEANHGHPEQQATARVNGWRFHLLPARPHLGSGGWSYLRPRAAIVNRGLRVEGKKEHQGAERDWHRAPQLLVLHDSKSHSLSCLTRRFRIHGRIPLRCLLYVRSGDWYASSQCNRQDPFKDCHPAGCHAVTIKVRSGLSAICWRKFLARMMQPLLAV